LERTVRWEKESTGERIQLMAIDAKGRGGLRKHEGIRNGEEKKKKLSSGTDEERVGLDRGVGH